jgi:hypothetical protein
MSCLVMARFVFNEWLSAVDEWLFFVADYVDSRTGLTTVMVNGNVPMKTGGRRECALTVAIFAEVVKAAEERVSA